ncbi:hypothetical protein K503DRAFT_416297 [Rhizopogon vinicolor AM-OR11-026]|uniref:Uncharacterized protein n=1 Tax=Rhizopogon vinicolor AM-OR11-026 TaxID=1314800 RepID=A0A1B7NB15_9AGAM|nr:hypothetical protein K503DRAFT_416297 [Rhizopogon vinicolor AM-OR11-026]
MLHSDGFFLLGQCILIAFTRAARRTVHICAAGTFFFFGITDTLAAVHASAPVKTRFLVEFLRVVLAVLSHSTCWSHQPPSLRLRYPRSCIQFTLSPVAICVVARQHFRTRILQLS